MSLSSGWSLFLRVGQLLSTLVPIWLTSKDTLKVGVINWCLFNWSICFSLTLLGFILELGSLSKPRLPNIQRLLHLYDMFQYHFRLFWDGVLYAFGSYFAVICLSGAVIFGSTCIQFFDPGPTQNHAITSTAFSCVAALLYAIEVAWVCHRPGRMSCFRPAFPGVLRRLENYAANIIFAFICNTDLYLHQPALVWCVAVYSTCFVLGVMNFLMNGCDCDNDKKLPLRFPHLLWVQTVLPVFLYVTAAILWPLYQFHEKLGGQPQRSSDMTCTDQLNIFVCIWDQRLAVAILTGINLLVYTADMVYLVREAFTLRGKQARLQTALLPVTYLTITNTMSLFSGLDGKTIMSLFLRVGQLLCTLLPIWLTSRDTLKVGVINWCLYIWCICFGLTFLGFLLELGSLFKLPLCNIRSLLRLSDKFQYHLPLSWDGVLHAFGSYFAVFCLSAAVIFGPTYIQFFSPGPARNRVITATACSCVAALLYAIDVAWVCRRPSRVSCFWPTFPGVLRRLENYVANIIFAFISNTDLSLHQPALVWCVAVYLICFLLGAVNYLVNGCDCDNDKKLPLRLPVLLWVQTVLSVLLYATAVILWPLYQFQEKLGEQPQRSSDMSCSDQLNIFVCVWDQRLAVAILTVINLLVYVADLVYLVREAFFLPDGPYRDWVAAASAFSCVISALYARDVACTWVAYGFKEVPCFVHTVPGLLKVLETFMAYVVSACIINTSLYLHQPALEWCVAVYSICFILAAVVLLLDLGKWEYRLPGPFSLFQLVLTLLSVLLCISALVLWPLYQFSEELGGQPQRPSDGDCREELTYDMCAWDQRLAVAVLTAINLLVYVADLGYWARQVSVGTEDQPRDS
ncbi:hypothetical protein R6Z07F_015497 [Ovis aries]